ncbi:MAG: hypothetical protein ACYCXA_06320 [Actinomycetes bacterium]
MATKGATDVNGQQTLNESCSAGQPGDVPSLAAGPEPTGRPEPRRLDGAGRARTTVVRSTTWEGRFGESGSDRLVSEAQAAG